MRYADPAAQAEIDRLRAGEDAASETLTPARLWHDLLEASEMRRLWVLGRLIEAQDDANRCFLEDHEGRLDGDAQP